MRRKAFTWAVIALLLLLLLALLLGEQLASHPDMHWRAMVALTGG